MKSLLTVTHIFDNRRRSISIPIRLRIRIIRVVLFICTIITIVRLNVLYQQQQIHDYWLQQQYKHFDTIHDDVSSSSISSSSSFFSSSSCLVHEPLYIPYIVYNTRRRKHPKTSIDSDYTSSNSISSNPNTTITTLSQSNEELTNNVSTFLIHDIPKYCGKLLRGPILWYNGYAIQSKIAKIIEIQQTNCLLVSSSSSNHQKAIFHLDNHNGIGAHIHLWSQAMLCNIMSISSSTSNGTSSSNGIPVLGQYRIQTYNPNWLWLDTTYCPNINYNNHHQNSNHAPSSSSNHISPFHCYFPKMEHRCPNDIIAATTTGMSIADIPNITYSPYTRKKCPINHHHHHFNMDNNINDTSSTSLSFISEFRAATSEYIFQSINPIIVQEAERQIGLLFSNHSTNTTNNNNNNIVHSDSHVLVITIPDDLIVVHLRWGDKFFEMDLVSIQEYVNAILYMLLFIMERPNVTLANIYIACEDPNAIYAFLNYTNIYYPMWNIYIDRTVIELQSYRPTNGNRASWTSRNTNGRAGLMAIASILICLESNYYILTTGSNYSRLINELRKNVINPRCSNCTHMIDLRPGEW